MASNIPHQSANSGEDTSGEDSLPPKTIVFDKKQRVFASLFILTHFACGIITLLPPSPAAERLQSAVKPAMRMLSLNQNWKLFSPDLRHINFYSSALITFQDGSMKVYTFPRLERMPLWERIPRQKLSKLVQDCMPWPDQSAFWPSVARFLARANITPGNQPVMVELAYNWTNIPDFDHYITQEELEDWREPTSRFTFFIYEVKPEDLK